MTEEISLAFAHPSERAAATASSVPLDRISLRGHVRKAEIGAFQSERGVSQRLSFDVVAEVAPPPADVADDVDRILSYDRITEAIDDELTAGRLNLLETLAERVAERVLAEPRAVRVFVRVEKLDRGPGALGVEIVRTPSRGAPEAASGDAPVPEVLLLGEAFVSAWDLPARIDTIEGRPAVLCLELPERVPRAAGAAAQRRIDLLAIEQNGWRLAARDPRCVVIGTRTEIDHALRNGRLVVWAPSKMVLDAFDAPVETDGASLAAWLAGELGAGEVRRP
ncbi:dihydroneopterin aldolase [Hasllibacter halocynthiae]|uniref:dihydroneopterin aldolase n=1 Tax=Hasllibacter halocynthiae TaxID=595589 RepID=A0A2T0X6B1_9RHOB|nr:dihydroneopterin aldolase [Hasllibacter halocynthiae]PRY94492.1 dihydroneopterin aldolase [Hasllibacter halocynthiae]